MSAGTFLMIHIKRRKNNYESLTLKSLDDVNFVGIVTKIARPSSQKLLPPCGPNGVILSHLFFSSTRLKLQ